MQAPHSCPGCTEGVVVGKRVAYCAPKTLPRPDGTGSRPTDRKSSDVLNAVLIRSLEITYTAIVVEKACRLEEWPRRSKVGVHLRVASRS